MVANEQVLSDDMLNTLFCVAEDVVNGRPLSHISADGRDLQPLSPNDLLRPNTMVNFPLGMFSNADKYKRKWRHIQHLGNVFWRRWKSEYLPQLQARTKWLKERRNFMVGDVVIMVDDSAHRSSWPLARIVEVYPDQGGMVRSVMIKTSKGTYKRPITKLCLLETAD